MLVPTGDFTHAPTQYILGGCWGQVGQLSVHGPEQKIGRPVFMSHLVLPLTTNCPPVNHSLSLRFIFSTFHMTLLSFLPLVVGSCEA